MVLNLLTGRIAVPAAAAGRSRCSAIFQHSAIKVSFWMVVQIFLKESGDIEHLKVLFIIMTGIEA